MQLCGTVTAYSIDPKIETGRIKPYTPHELRELLAEGYARERVVCSNRIVSLGISTVTRLIGAGRGSPLEIANAATAPGTTVAFASIDNLRVDIMAFGDELSPDANDATVTTLSSQVSIYNATEANGGLTVTYPDYHSVQFGGFIPADVIEPTQITELGLFMSALANPLPAQEEGILFARSVLTTPVPVVAGVANQINHKLGPFTSQQV